MFCEVCGNVDAITLTIMVVNSFDKGLPLNSKNIKVCPACNGWLLATRKCNGSTIDIEEGKPITLYEIKSYSWGTQPTKVKKNPKTLADYIEKTNKKSKTT